jgi:hypothetical protein
MDEWAHSSISLKFANFAGRRVVGVQVPPPISLSLPLSLARSLALSLLLSRSLARSLPRSLAHSLTRLGRRRCTGTTSARKVDVRLPGKENSNSHGARPVHLITRMIELIRTSRLAMKDSLSLAKHPGEWAAANFADGVQVLLPLLHYSRA